jgi:hypothetical protein
VIRLKKLESRLQALIIPSQLERSSALAEQGVEADGAAFAGLAAVDLIAFGFRQLRPNKSKKPIAILKGFFSFLTEYKSFFVLRHVLDVDNATQASCVSFISFIGGPDRHKNRSGVGVTFARMAETQGMPT